MKYKKSSIRWETLIPTHWDEIKGKHIFVNEKEIIGDYWINEQRISLTYDGVIPRDNDDTSGLNPASLSTYQVVKQNDLLFKLIDLENEKTSRVGLSEHKGITSSAYIRINVNNMHPKYYYYWYYSLWFRYIYNRLGNGVRSTLNAKDLLNLLVPVPPKNEQIKISETIDGSIIKIDRLIQIQEQQIEKLKEYKQSTISSVVTEGLKKNVTFKNSNLDWIKKIPGNWETGILKNSYHFGKGLSITKEDLKDEGIACISYGEVHSKYPVSFNIAKDYLKCVDSSYLISNPQSILRSGDFIFADTSEDIEGSGNYSMNEGEDVFAGYHSVTLKNQDKRINNNYLKYLFYSDFWRFQIRSRVVGIKVFTISQKIIKNCTILVPPLDEQGEIIFYLDNKCKLIDLQLNVLKSKIEKLNEYKKSLIYEYVTGKKEV